MKIFSGLLALLISTLIGYFASLKYKKRYDFYLYFYNFNKILKNEVQFKQTTILQIIEQEREQTDFYNVLSDFFERDNATVSLEYLKTHEKRFVSDYLLTIGVGDRQSQIKYLDGVTFSIEQNLSNSENEYKRNKSLFVRLGFLIGLAIFIIIL